MGRDKVREYKQRLFIAADRYLRLMEEGFHDGGEHYFVVLTPLGQSLARLLGLETAIKTGAELQAMATPPPTQERGQA